MARDDLFQKCSWTFLATRKDVIFIRSSVSRWWGDIGSDVKKVAQGGKIYGKAHKSKRSSCAEKSYYWMQNVPIYLNVKYEIQLLNRWFPCILLNIRNWIYGHECGKGLFMHGNIQWKVYIRHKPSGRTPLTYLIWWHPNSFRLYQKKSVLVLLNKLRKTQFTKKKNIFAGSLCVGEVE